MAPEESTARNPLGAIGQNVIANLKRLREERRLRYTELAVRLEEIGRPIPVLGLSRIEKGRRRVDVDDLVALAIALRVHPSALLLPHSGSEEGGIELAPNVRRRRLRVWRWMNGEGPLPQGDDDRVSLQEIVDFMTHAQREGAPVPEAVRELQDRYGHASTPSSDEAQ